MSESGAGRPGGPWPDLQDDGACDHLVGAELPSLAFDSTAGRVDLSELATDLLVLFLYPHGTGLPDAPVPGWDLIPGARGCTAQSCAFRDRHARLSELGATLAGLSVQTVAEQREFAARTGVRYRLISDPARSLADATGVPTFTAGGRTFYKRVTLIASGGRIVKVFYPVAYPEQSAADVVAWVEKAGPPTAQHQQLPDHPRP
jgi:peroxiredoxin